MEEGLLITVSFLFLYAKITHSFMNTINIIYLHKGGNYYEKDYNNNRIYYGGNDRDWIYII